MQCKDVMLTLVYRCRPETTAFACAQKMRAEQIGFMPVVNEVGATVGVITDRDLVLRVLAEGKSAETPVGSVMSPGPFLICHPDEDLHVLEQRMARARKSRALVQDERGALLGVISLSDIAQAEPLSIRTGKLMRDVTRREAAIVARP